jgi:uncharacterized membrane protein YdjX (TVP38/TMEM64 family)
MAQTSRPVAAWLARHRRQLFAFLISCVITALVLTFADQLVQLKAYGYAGVFVVSLLGNATVVLPVPSLAVVFAGGSVLNPLLVGLVSGVAEPLGELTGYLAGYGGSAIVEDQSKYGRLAEFVQRRGFVTILVLSAIPNPLFDLAGIAAGASRYPVAKFLGACWVGKTIKAVAVAYLGSLSVDWVTRWLG